MGIQPLSHPELNEVASKLLLDPFYSQIVQGMPGAFYICDEKGIITYYNDLAVELWGRKPQLGVDQWCGSWKIYHLDGTPLPLDECPMAIALREGKAINDVEIVIERPDGGRLNILPHPTPIFDKQGVLVGAFNVLLDITKHKKTEERIIENDLFLERMLNNSNDSIAVLDLEGRLVSMNEKGRNSFEVGDYGMRVGANWKDFWKGSDWHAAQEAIEKAKYGQTGRFIGYFPSFQSLTARWWDVAVTPIPDNNGKIERLLTIARDVTHQKMLQIELAEKNKSLDILYQIGKTVSGQLELKKIVQAVTDAATDISGAEFGVFIYNEVEDGKAYTFYNVSGVSKNQFDRIKLPNVYKFFSLRFQNDGIIRVGDVRLDNEYQNDLENLQEEGIALSVVSYMAVPVISRNGQVLGGLFFGHSKVAVFTQKVEEIVRGIAAHAAIAMDNSRLYEASLKDKQALSEKNTQLERTNTDLDNFIYTASHDLKAPVSNIEGLVNALKDLMESPCNAHSEAEANLIMEMIDRSISRFKATIQDLTEISKVQKQDSEDVNVIDCLQIIEDVQLSIGDQIAKTHATVTIEVQDAIALKFSRKNFKSIVYNLLSNAIKYKSNDRPPEVKIRVARIGNNVLLSVQDNGLGIKETYMPKLFSMFKRFHDHVEGTGIGLYIVKRIVDNAGGRIEVMSKEGEGTTFFIYLKTS